MFEIPYLYGTFSYLTNISQPKLHAFRDLCSFRSTTRGDTDIFALCCQILVENQLYVPNTPEEAVHAYLKLRQTIRDLTRYILVFDKNCIKDALNFVNFVGHEIGHFWKSCQ